MNDRLSNLILSAALRDPLAIALRRDGESLTYGDLAQAVEGFARGLVAGGLHRTERVAVYLDKRFETVVASFGAAHAGGVFVPLNPVLKGPPGAAHHDRLQRPRSGDKRRSSGGVVGCVAPLSGPAHRRSG